MSFGLAACGGSNGGTTPVTVNPASAPLQLAVGTANIFGDVSGSTNVGLNVVETYRQTAAEQTAGDTNALVDTPTLTGPFTLPTAGSVSGTCATPDTGGATIETGPAPSDAGGHVIRATPQQDPGTPTVPTSTFGVETNASGQGLEPFNFTSINGNNAGTPVSYVPFAIPFFDPLYAASSATCSPNGTDPNGFVPWGGPPAYDPNKDGFGVRDGNPVPTGVLGVSLGLDVFENVAPAPGAYTLSVTVPKNGGGVSTATATATLATKILPAIAPAVVTLDGTGGGTVTATLPPGVTEALVQVEDLGLDATAPKGAVSCDPATPVYYTLVFHTSGSQPLADAIGPKVGTAGSPTLCTAAQNSAANATANGGTGSALDGDAFAVQTVGFDYPAYEAGYPQSNGNPAPTLLGGAGQADVTISSSTICTVPATAAVCAPAATPADKVRAALVRRKFDNVLRRLHVQSTVRVRRA